MAGAKKTEAVRSAGEETSDDIDQIINEIDQLEAELNAQSKEGDFEPSPPPSPRPQLKAVESHPTQESEVLSEFRAGATTTAGEGLEDTLANLKDDEESSGNGLLDQAVNSSEDDPESEEEDDVEEFEPQEELDIQDEISDAHEKWESSEDTSDGALSMTLTGKMKLKLRYNFQGQDIMVSFTDHALKVELADGTEFKIPLGKGKRQKAA